MSTPYGLSALMETINNIEAEEKISDELNDIAAGTTESVTYMDAVEAGLMKDKIDIDDEDDIDDGAEDFMDDVDPDDEEINRMLDNIDEDDEDEIGLENLNAALEAYIADHE